MDLFRRKQKLIFWIVTIIIVPSFVLVWGVGGMSGGRSGGDFEVGRVDGKRVMYSEFEAFRKRIQAAIGGIPLDTPFTAGRGTNAEELYKYLIVYALLQDAEDAGSRASDLQIGTYIDNAHPVIAGRDRSDPQSRDRAVDAVCRQMQITRQQFLQGVREWQTIGNYIFTDADLAALTDEEVYRVFSLVNGEMVVKRVRIMETEAIKDQAKKEVMEKPAADLEREVRNYIAGKSGDPKYREPSEWRFAYILTPFTPKMSVRQPGDAEIEERYNTGKASRYNDLPLAEVRERIKDELLREEVENQTLRNLRVDVDNVLRERERDTELSELVKIAQVAKYGVTSGDTGTEALPLEEALKKLPQGEEFRLQARLERLDRQLPAARDAEIARWKAGFDIAELPYVSELGLYRLRLLDYRPSRPADIDTPEGGIKPAFFEAAVVDMVNDRVDQLVAERAADMERRIRDHMIALEQGRDTPDAAFAEEFSALPDETISNMRIPEDQSALAGMVIGDVMGPLPYRNDAGAKGAELIVVMSRRVPSRADFADVPAERKQQMRQGTLNEFRGGFGTTYTYAGPVASIQPGPGITGSIVDRLANNRIGVNPELVQMVNSEG